MGIMLGCLIGTIAIFAKYALDERSILWMGLSGYCGVLLFFSYIFCYMRTKFIKTRFTYFLLFVFAVMLLYLLIMLGKVTADITIGPVTKEVLIEKKWDPRRGGDQVTTSDGDHYEIAGSHVIIEPGRKYVITVFEHSRLIVNSREIR
ncbi:hypothetical protein [Brevibacillus reuszeri]|uniref:hypothetical protein n=1 Tax=Brevibacillus reuszeri TaxID=54915 RepID=UPI001BB368CB|nr:hypothetical protein [Brevibacillus reuszeri]